MAYTVQTWDVEQSRKYNQRIEEALASLRSTPRQGRPHSMLPPGFQVYHVEPHYIVYTVEVNRITILRILHDQMDLPRYTKYLIIGTSWMDNQENQQ